MNVGAERDLENRRIQDVRTRTVGVNLAPRSKWRNLQLRTWTWRFRIRGR